jgi:rubrerythrin
LDKRYKIRYGESPIQNLQRIKETGLDSFINLEKEKWKCLKCGNLLCVHREVCLICGNKNGYFPQA